MKKYGHIIASLRKKAGLTQDQLGQKLNVTYQAVSKWENNLSEPDLETIDKITQIFGITVAQFFDMEQNPNLNIKEQKNIPKQQVTGLDFISKKPWWLIAGLGILIFILSLCVFFIPKQQSSDNIFKNISPSTFSINTYKEYDHLYRSTGFFINNSGLAVTTFDIIDGATRGNINLDGKTYSIESVVGVDKEQDIALIQIDITHSKPVVIGSAGTELAQKVYTVGYNQNCQAILNESLISKISHENNHKYWQLLTTSCQDGSALVNQYGQVVGMITSSFYGDAGMNTAVPLIELNNIYSNGLVIAKQEFLNGHKVKPIDNPIRTGYSFAGWYTNETFETKFDFDSQVTTQNACYAKWTPNTYSIKFNANGGTGQMADITATYDVDLDLPTCTFEVENYVFAGWSQTGNNDVLMDGQTIKNLSSINGEIVELTALWEKIKYTIVFDGNTADSGIMENLTLEYDQTANLPLNQFTKAGYIFSGWKYNNQTFEDNAEIVSLINQKTNITLVAEWTPITYTIRFEFEEQTAYTQTFTYDEPLNLLSNKFAKDYHNFMGWSCSEFWGSFKDQQEILNLTTENNKIFVFEGRFDEYTYTLRYNPSNFVDLENCHAVTYKYSQKGVVSHNVFSKTGYKFSHWLDDNSKIYKQTLVYENGRYTWVGGEFEKLTDVDKGIVDLYAVWEEITYTAYYKYELKNETKYTKIGTKTYEEEFVLTDPEYVDDGYEFTNWELYSKTYSQNETVSKLTWTDKSTVYILAKYQPKQYLVNFDGNGATSGEMSAISATFDSSVTIPENSFIKDGYTFLGWQFNDNFYATTDIGKPISVYTDNITLTACWTKNLNGEGTFTNPYTISTVKDLDTLADLTIVNQFENCYVSLTNDINCEFSKLKEINFAGTFEGNGYKLINVDYANGTLFKENNGIIRNLSIENLKINVINEDVNQDTYIAGLVKSNRGFISRCYVQGSITIQSAGNISVYGLVGSNMHNYSYGVIQRQIEFCFAELNVDVLCENDINKCIVYGFAGGHNYAVDYNYSILNLTADFKNVNTLTINPFGSKNNHSFSQTNINVTADEVSSYNFKQTTPYYSDYSSIKLIIGGKSVPKLVETTLELSNIKNKDWMENNLFNIKGIWLYDSEHLPTPSFTHQTIIDTQEQFLSLYDNILYGEYILNCDIDLSENTSFIIRGNYGVFNGNGHIIRNFSLKENEYKNIYALFETNHGIIKNLGIENLNIGFTARKKLVVGAGLVHENYGIVNSCYVKGSISISNIDGDAIAGGIVAISKGGKVFNSYSDVSVYACSTSDVPVSCYAGGIIATGEGVVENCYSLKGVSSKAPYAVGDTFSAYGISGADGIVKNSFVLSNVSVSQYSSSSEYQIGGISKDYENSFAYEWQAITKLEEDLSFGDKSYEELCSKEFLDTLGFKNFTTKENLTENQNAVWVITETDLPKLWFEN